MYVYFENYLRMKTATNSNITFYQIMLMVKQQPKQQKIKLSEELEKKVIDSKLSRLLKSFKTDELEIETITKEVESVRQELYELKF